MTVYLASPFFNDEERRIKAQVKEHLTKIGFEVIDPQNGDNEESWEMPNHVWGEHVWQKDVDRIDAADYVVAVDWGMYADCGTAWEIGYAWAKEKDVFVIVPREAYNTNHSLMVMNGCNNAIGLKRFLTFASIEDLFNKGEMTINFLAGIRQG